MSKAGPDHARSPLKVALTAAAGAAIEWYDFFIYGTAAALVFPTLFFPADIPPVAAQIAAFSTFAVGFVARPVGGMLFGHFGDLFGRKRALVTALILMGLSTAAIGMLPSYAQAGVLAPILLVALRFAQGLAVGGQWGGAALLAIESAPPGRRGLYGSFVQIGVPLGVVLANTAFLVIGATMPQADFLSWGWRVPFLLSLALVGIGLYVQLRLEESAEFDAVRVAPQAPRRSPILAVLRSHPRQILLAGGAFVANNTCFYVTITYAVAYGTATLGISRNVMLGGVMIASALMIPVLILCGLLSDRVGRLRPFLWGAVLAGIWAFAFFPLIETRAVLAIGLSIMVQLGFLSLMYGPQAALFAELFPVELRYSGASLGYQLGAVLGGGMAPIIATALQARFESSFAIAVYLFAMCAVSFFCTLALRRHALPTQPRTAAASR